ncbi:MAG: hypothetical protein Q4D47_04345 [Erysipelotrichaceae bacterium]|nr:hypothetical protein [Erysipelotrichaceae bacterium]
MGQVRDRGNIRYYIPSAFAIDSEKKKEQERNDFKRIDDSFENDETMIDE